MSISNRISAGAPSFKTPESREMELSPGSIPAELCSLEGTKEGYRPTRIEIDEKRAELVREIRESMSWHLEKEDEETSLTESLCSLSSGSDGTGIKSLEEGLYFKLLELERCGSAGFLRNNIGCSVELNKINHPLSLPSFFYENFRYFLSSPFLGLMGPNCLKNWRTFFILKIMDTLNRGCFSIYNFILQEKNAPKIVDSSEQKNLEEEANKILLETKDEVKIFVDMCRSQHNLQHIENMDRPSRVKNVIRQKNNTFLGLIDHHQHNNVMVYSTWIRISGMYPDESLYLNEEKKYFLTKEIGDCSYQSTFIYSLFERDDAIDIIAGYFDRCPGAQIIYERAAKKIWKVPVIENIHELKEKLTILKEKVIPFYVDYVSSQKYKAIRKSIEIKAEVADLPKEMFRSICLVWKTALMAVFAEVFKREYERQELIKTMVSSRS